MQITDDMVERAYAIWAARECINPSALSEKRSMRAALLAALTPPTGAVGGWIACSERMPELDEQVMAAHVSGDYFRAYRQRDGSWVNCTAVCLESTMIHMEAETVTYWQPLPTPPAAKGEG